MDFTTAPQTIHESVAARPSRSDRLRRGLLPLNFSSVRPPSFVPSFLRVRRTTLDSMRGSVVATAAITRCFDERGENPKSPLSSM